MWFIWSYSVHKRKHFTDAQEIEMYDTIRKYINEELDRREKVQQKIETEKFNQHFPTPTFEDPQNIQHPKKVEEYPDLDKEELNTAISGLFKWK